MVGTQDVCPPLIGAVRRGLVAAIAAVARGGDDQRPRRAPRIIGWGIATVGFAGVMAIAPASFGDPIKPGNAPLSATATACTTATFASNALGALGATAQFLLCNLNSVIYTVHTEYVPTPGAAPVVRDTPGVLGSATPVFATGGTLPDLTASIEPTGTSNGIGLRVEISRTGSGPTTLPVSVEVILTAPPSVGLPRQNLAWGYDARTDTAPTDFHTSFVYQFSTSTSLPGLYATFGTHYPDQGRTILGTPARPTAHPLTLIGGVFNGTPESRTLPVSARLRFAPAFDGETTFGLDLGTTALIAHYRTPPPTWLLGPGPNPTVLTADIRGEKPSDGVDSIAIHTHVGNPAQPASSSNSMPAWVNVVYDQPHQNTENNDTIDVHYTAATSIDTLGSSLNLVTAGVPTAVTADAQGVPTDIALHYAKPNNDTMDVTYTASTAMARLNTTFNRTVGSSALVARVDVSDLPTFLAVHKRLDAGSCSGTPETCTPAQPEIEFTTTPPAPFSLPTGPVGHIDATVQQGDPSNFQTPDAPSAGDQGVSFIALPAGLSADTGAAFGPSVNARVVIDGLSYVDYKGHVSGTAAKPATVTSPAVPATTELPSYVRVVHAGGPFDLHATTSGAVVAAHIDYLPSTISLQAWTDQTKFQYDGSAPPTGQSLPTVTADITQGVATVHTVVTHVPDAFTATVDPAKGFVWHANSTLDRLQAKVDNLAGLPRIDADIQGVPADLTIGTDAANGLGLMDGASSAVQSASLLVGLDQWPSAIAPPAGKNAVYFNPQSKVLALQVYNLQGGWIDQAPDRLTGIPRTQLHTVLGPRPAGTAAPTLQATIQGTGGSGSSAIYAPGSPQFAGVRIGAHGLPDRLDLALTVGLPHGSRLSYHAYARCSTSAPGDPSGFCPAPIPGDLDLALTSASDSTDVGNVNESGLEAVVGDLPASARLCVGAQDDCDGQYFDRGAAWGTNSWDGWMCTQRLIGHCDPTGWVENPLLSPGGTNNDYTVQTDPQVVVRIATDPGLTTPIHLKSLVSCSNSSAPYQDFYNRPAFGGFGNCLNNIWFTGTLNPDSATTTPVLLPNWGPAAVFTSQDETNAFLNDYGVTSMDNATVKNLDFMVQTDDLPKHIIGGGTSGTASIVHLFVNTWGDHVTAERIQLGAATKSLVVDNLDMTTPASGHGKQWLVETSLPPTPYLHDGTLSCGSSQSLTASGFLPVDWFTGSNFIGLDLCN